MHKVLRNEKLAETRSAHLRNLSHHCISVSAILVLHAVYFEPPVNSSTIQDFHFPGLSRAWKIKEEKNPGGVETLIFMRSVVPAAPFSAGEV